MSQEMSFEAARGRLEQVVEQLERGDMTLQQVLDLYQEGQELARYCQEQLDAAELRVTELSSEAQTDQ